MSVILDKSALWAFLHEEPGGEKISSGLDGACISAVN